MSLDRQFDPFSKLSKMNLDDWFFNFTNLRRLILVVDLLPFVKRRKQILLVVSFLFAKPWKTYEFLINSRWIWVVDLKINHDLGCRFIKLSHLLRLPLKREFSIFQVGFNSATYRLMPQILSLTTLMHLKLELLTNFGILLWFFIVFLQFVTDRNL